MKALTVSDHVHQRLKLIALRHIMQTSIDAMNQGDANSMDTAAALAESVECYTTLAAADETEAPLPYEAGALLDTRAAGVDPQKEYGPRHATGYQHCTHGRRLSEPCELCAATEARNPVLPCAHGVPLDKDCQGCRDDHAAALTSGPVTADDLPAS